MSETYTPSNEEKSRIIEDLRMKIRELEKNSLEQILSELEKEGYCFNNIDHTERTDGKNWEHITRRKHAKLPLPSKVVGYGETPKQAALACLKKVREQ